MITTLLLRPWACLFAALIFLSGCGTDVPTLPGDKDDSVEEATQDQQNDANQPDSQSPVISEPDEDTEPPQMYFSSPEDQAQIQKLQISFELSYTDDDVVDKQSLYFALNKKPYDLLCTVGNYTARCLTYEPLAPGLYTLAAYLSDKSGNETTAGIQFAVVEPQSQVQIDTPPSLSILSPSPGAVLSTPVTVDLSISQGSGQVDLNLLYLKANNLVLSKNCKPVADHLSCEVLTPLNSGSYTLAASIEDDNGLEANDQVIFEIASKSTGEETELNNGDQNQDTPTDPNTPPNEEDEPTTQTPVDGNTQTPSEEPTEPQDQEPEEPSQAPPVQDEPTVQPLVDISFDGPDESIPLSNENIEFIFNYSEND